MTHVAALKGMVDDFTQYAHASRMNARAVNLNELVREVLVLYEAMGVAIEPRLAENLPPIYADPAMLRQVLHNLFQNAIDALTGVESPRILVSTEPRARAACSSRCATTAPASPRASWAASSSRTSRPSPRARAWASRS